MKLCNKALSEIKSCSFRIRVQFNCTRNFLVSDVVICKFLVKCERCQAKFKDEAALAEHRMTHIFNREHSLTQNGVVEPSTGVV